MDFDRVGAGAIPPFWSVRDTHTVPSQRWEVVADKTAPSREKVFAQVSDGGRGFQPVIFDKVACKDADLSVKFRITGGHGSQSAGLVWRYQDPSNYYLLEFSADQHRMTLVRMAAGQEKVIPISSGRKYFESLSHDLNPGQWYVAKVSFRGNRVRVSFGNRLLFESSDDSSVSAGKTGLWTKTGTRAEFDDFRLDQKD